MPNNPTKTTKNPDKTFVITLTLDKKSLTEAQDAVLKAHQAGFEIKGFRKGKAPLNIVKEHLDESHLIEDVLSRLITKLYSEELTKNDLHPIIQPQIKILNPPLTFDKDWQVEVTGCELPDLTLAADYSKDVAKINKSTVADNEKINQIIATLIKHSQVTIPQILIDADVRNKLSQLIDQTQQAGITVDQYLKSRQQTLEQYQTAVAAEVKNEWITNLTIDKIARDQKLEISQAEVDEVISKNKELAKNLNLVYYLLTQQKVFAYLRKL